MAGIETVQRLGQMGGAVPQANWSDLLRGLRWRCPAPRATYLSAIVVGGATVVGISLYDLSHAVFGWPLLVVLALTMLSGFATLRLPWVGFSFSVSDTFTITAALLFGPAAGTVAVVLDCLVISFRLAKRELGFQRLMFNIAAPAFAMWLAARCFVALVGARALVQSSVPLGRWLAPLLIFTVLYFVLNSGFVAGAVAATERKSFWGTWRHHFLPLWLTHFGGAAVAALLIALVQSRGADPLALALVAPIPFILYATFKGVVGRIEDQLAHLRQVNAMHLATIETLAHAIDAKDEVTHGHIRRVQQQALRLAAKLGIDADRELRAIEVASLLHDLGKLAIPEHILNKPGKLIPAEFAKMKEHASIGAEILSSIEFPYPVEPIVRHHHENWDGTGYPAGLKGDDIPIGARILQVVDCFDALTSDRPYRPKMTSADAMAIVRGRVGGMYDPDVVAAFVALHADEQPEPEATHGSPALSAIVETVQSDAARRRSSGTLRFDPRVAAAMYDLGEAIARNGPRLADWLHGTLAQIMPATCTVIFGYEATSDELFVQHVAGRPSPEPQNLVIPVGQRVSGWVAAHRSTIVNSDAALDLGSLAMQLDPPLRSCLSTAICTGDQLVGVVTVYSADVDAFDESHGALLEVLGARIAGRLLETILCSASTIPKELAYRQRGVQRP
jgi:putative nucleotidyltransferase with HDIG domain